MHLDAAGDFYISSVKRREGLFCTNKTSVLLRISMRAESVLITQKRPFFLFQQLAAGCPAGCNRCDMQAASCSSNDTFVSCQKRATGTCSRDAAAASSAGTLEQSHRYRGTPDAPGNHHLKWTNYNGWAFADPASVFFWSCFELSA